MSSRNWRSCGWRGRGGRAGGVLAREPRVERTGAQCGSGPGGLYREEVRTLAAASSEVGGGGQRRDGAGIRSGAVCAKAQRQETWEPS